MNGLPDKIKFINAEILIFKWLTKFLFKSLTLSFFV